MRTQRPLGMQIHAVPEAERAVDSTGRKLPWGYDYSAPVGTDPDQREPMEKGPFGKSLRRTNSRATRSRTRTAEPRRDEDRIRAENLAAEDAVFGSLRRAATKEEMRRDALGEVDPNTTQQGARTPAAMDGDSEPTEVMLYGFGDELQWSAIDYYERVSGGIIIEDFDRVPTGQRYDVTKSLGRQTALRSLSRAALKKKNTFRGGNNWIKVTFDSRQAAELAIARAPHIVKGYLVYAVYFQGRGPQKDEPIFATQAGAQLTSEDLPPSLSIDNPQGSPNGSSETATSATVTGAGAAPMRSGTRPTLPWNAPLAQDSPTNSSATMHDMTRSHPQDPVQAPLTPTVSKSSSFQPRPGAPKALQPRRGRIDGTTRVTVLPAEMALAPKQPKASWSAWLGTGEIIGGAVPRKEDGSFDWDSASLYWRIFAWLDWFFNTDLCGLKAD